MKIPFGDFSLAPHGTAIYRINKAISNNRITEGENVRDLEQRFAEIFGWKHAIMTSSGSTAAQVVWSAIREKESIGWAMRWVITPASAFVSTACSLLAGGLWEAFIDIDETLNIDPLRVALLMNGPSGAMQVRLAAPIGIQFVANMGRFIHAPEITEIADKHDLWFIGDLCEGHGGMIDGKHCEWFDAAIYSMFPAHMVIAGEGGMICTDHDEIANLCRSIKNHGRPFGGSNLMKFDRIGFNAKANELTAAVGLETIELFPEVFDRRRAIREEMLYRLAKFEQLILFPDAPGEVIAPHAFPILLKDENADIEPLYRHLNRREVECKLLFGSLPTQHEAFSFMNYARGAFPVAERVGRTGLHWGLWDGITKEHLDYLVRCLEEFFG